MDTTMIAESTQAVVTQVVAQVDSIAKIAVSGGKINWTYIIIFALGTGIPFAIGLLLPRRKTISYGRLIYKFLGTLLLQKRQVSGLIATLRSTLTDLSFGIYIESKSDITMDEKKNRIEEYIKITTDTK